MIQSDASTQQSKTQKSVPSYIFYYGNGCTKQYKSEKKYLAKTDVMISQIQICSISRMKNNKKILEKAAEQNNECLLFLVMFYIYNRFLKKNCNLALIFWYFQHFVGSSTSFTAFWLSNFMYPRVARLYYGLIQR